MDSPENLKEAFLNRRHSRDRHHRFWWYRLIMCLVAIPAIVGLVLFVVSPHHQWLSWALIIPSVTLFFLLWLVAGKRDIPLEPDV